MRLISAFITLILMLYFFHGVISTPRLDRDWTADQKILAEITFNEKLINIKNVRNISYRSTDDYDVSYYNKTVNIDDIRTAWFLVEPFGRFGAAHTLASFGFADGSYIAVSAEIRKERGETFSPLKGILRKYELVYVIADESDVIRLRTNYRQDQARLYPVKTDKDKIQMVFIDMLKRAQQLAEKPEFYNTISNNCTTNLVRHVRKFSDKNIPWYDLRYLMPEHSDDLAYKAGILDTDLSIHEARQVYYITDKAQSCSGHENFSACIRHR